MTGGGSKNGKPRVNSPFSPPEKDDQNGRSSIRHRCRQPCPTAPLEPAEPVQPTTPSSSSSSSSYYPLTSPPTARRPPAIAVEIENRRPAPTLRRLSPSCNLSPPTIPSQAPAQRTEKTPCASSCQGTSSLRSTHVRPSVPEINLLPREAKRDPREPHPPFPRPSPPR